MGRILVKRIERGLKQEQVAQELGITQGTISQWETGRCFPRAELLPKIAVLYGCSINDLFDDEQEVSESGAKKEAPEGAKT